MKANIATRDMAQLEMSTLLAELVGAAVEEVEDEVEVEELDSEVLIEAVVALVIMLDVVIGVLVAGVEVAT